MSNQRVIQDKEVKDMIAFLQTSGISTLVVEDACAMLAELLKLREKVRRAD